MKFSISYLFFMMFVLQTNGQSVEKIVGAHSDGTQQIFSSLIISDLNYTQLSVLGSNANSSFGETTFDHFNNRYFVKRDSTVYIINAISGNILDSMNHMGLFYNMEYDGVSNTLIGLSVSGGSFVCKIYDLATKIGSIKGTLIGVDSIVIGESTFDQVNRRYFTVADIGLTAIDSNGFYNDVLCSSPYLFGVEYNPLNNKIYYLELRFGVIDFVSIEANICNIEVLATYNTLTTTVRGESTFDKEKGIYYNKTNLGISRFLAQTGQLVGTLPVINNIGGLEYNSVSATANIFSQTYENGISVFPNPSTGLFYFDKMKIGSSIEVVDVNGKQIFKSELLEKSFLLDLKNQSFGMYFYKIYDSEGKMQFGKLILK